MQFELWDTDGANLVGFFETEAEALRVVLDMIDSYGSDSVATYMLSSMSANGARSVMADGEALKRLEVARVGQPEPTSSTA